MLRVQSGRSVLYNSLTEFVHLLLICIDFSSPNCGNMNSTWCSFTNKITFKQDSMLRKSRSCSNAQVKSVMKSPCIPKNVSGQSPKYFGLIPELSCPLQISKSWLQASVSHVSNYSTQRKFRLISKAKTFGIGYTSCSAFVVAVVQRTIGRIDGTQQAAASGVGQIFAAAAAL